MVVFYYGADSYRLRKAKLDLVEEYSKKNSGKVDLFYFNLSEELNLTKVKDALRSASFFNEAKLIIVSDIFNKKSFADEIEPLIESLNRSTDSVLLFTEVMSEKDLSTKDEKLFKILSGAKLVKSFESLNGSKLAQWAKSEVESRGCSIQDGTLAKLLNLTGSDSWAVINEIDKLSAYKKRGEISIADVSLLVSQKPESNVFDFVDMLGTGNTRGALVLLYRELGNNADPYQILGAVIYQLRNMLIVKDMLSKNIPATDISKKAGLHPFVVKKTMNQVNKFDMNKLKKLYGELLALDINFKNGNISLELGLNKFILSV